MASFGEVIRLIRGADTAERARQLQILSDAFVPPDKRMAAALDMLRAANAGQRRKILNELTEQYAEDNPDDDKPKESRKDRGRRNLVKFIRDEKRAGRPRPSRQSIETKIRRDERISQRQLDQDLVEDYEECVALGLVSPRA